MADHIEQVKQEACFMRCTNYRILGSLGAFLCCVQMPKTESERAARTPCTSTLSDRSHPNRSAAAFILVRLSPCRYHQRPTRSGGLMQVLPEQIQSKSNSFAPFRPRPFTQYIVCHRDPKRSVNSFGISTQFFRFLHRHLGIHLWTLCFANIIAHLAA